MIKMTEREKILFAAAAALDWIGLDSFHSSSMMYALLEYIHICNNI